MKMGQWFGMAVGAAALTAGLVVLTGGESLAAKPAVAAAGVAGKVTFLKGTALHAATAKGPFKPLKRNDSVREGEFLKTNAASMLEVKLADGSLMRLAPNSNLKLGLAKSDTQEKHPTQHKLTAGKMWAKITKSVGTESKFAVRTENAVAGVRGTTFRVNAEEDGATVVKVYEGAVAVSNGPLVEKAAAGGGEKGPIDFKNRKPVEGPKEVTLQEWEKICGKMMGIKVAANGELAEPETFTAENDAANAEDAEWVAWNTQKDAEPDTAQ